MVGSPREGNRPSRVGLDRNLDVLPRLYFATTGEEVE
jgi:hypothetical protein